MRKFNAVLSMIILVLFIIHGVLGAFNLMGVGSVTTRVLSHTMVSLIVVHTIIGVVLTIRTLKIQKKAGRAYLRENTLFWGRRISGFVIMILIFFHLTAFMGVTADNYRLPYFGTFKLVTQILLVIAVAFHVISNAKPILIALGIRRLKPRVNDLIFWLSILLLFMAVGFIIYYIRWRAV